MDDSSKLALDNTKRKPHIILSMVKIEQDCLPFLFPILTSKYYSESCIYNITEWHESQDSSDGPKIKLTLN